MTPIQFAIDTGFVISLMFLGGWLENINGVHGFLDKFFTPFPMGGVGLSMDFAKWYLT